jgi:peptidoglycan/LPS O-acetylase OafA/YrhL
MAARLGPTRAHLEEAIARLRIPALRDIVEKTPSQGRNLPVLDGVRGLAVFLVVASHTHAFSLRGHGAVGVWLFLALSAFLLIQPFAIRPARALEWRTLGRYFQRRVQRIVPAYVVAIGITALVMDFDRTTLMRHLLLLQADGVLWTVPQEMLCYLVLPVVAVLHALVSRRAIPGTVAAIAVVATLANLYLDESLFSLNGNHTELRWYLGIFLTGLAFGYAIHWPPLAAALERPRVAQALGALGLALLIGLFVSARDFVEPIPDSVPLLGSLHGPLGWSRPGTFGVICGAIIAIAVTCERSLLARLLSSLALRALGVVSFSLYLAHVLIRDVFVDRVAWGWPLFAVTLILSYAVACVSYSWIERPFMRIGVRPATDP